MGNEKNKKSVDLTACLRYNYKRSNDPSSDGANVTGPE